MIQKIHDWPKKITLFFLIFREYYIYKKMLAQGSLAQGSKGCVQSDFIDKYFSLL
jgi:hypothetical protein